ncbi:MAG: sugar phosphate nucleotidyltransferase, partial [Cyclobacteriaceae bacterium]
MKIVNVILSGGVGSRLWPLSRKSRPKQYLSIFNGESLFEKTVKRNRSVCNQIMVVGGVDNYQLSREILYNTDQQSYLELIEAAPRNTAAAIAFAAIFLDPEDILLVTPSDHLIGDLEKYTAALESAISLAKEGYLVTFGLVPTKPETGFGYIEYHNNDVLSFREKPNADLAKKFIEKGNFLWNSGMFCFSAGTYLKELEKYEPAVLSASKLALSAAENGFLPLDLSMEIPSISVDFAVMEKSSKIKVVPSAFDWSDMGSFDALYEYFPKESKEKRGSNLVLGSEKHVEIVGLEGIILVETPDAILVLNRNNAQEVKKVYERLERDNPQ